MEIKWVSSCSLSSDCSVTEYLLVINVCLIKSPVLILFVVSASEFMWYWCGVRPQRLQRGWGSQEGGRRSEGPGQRGNILLQSTNLLLYILYIVIHSTHFSQKIYFSSFLISHSEPQNSLQFISPQFYMTRSHWKLIWMKNLMRIRGCFKQCLQYFSI